MNMKYIQKNKFTFFILIFFLVLFGLLLQAKNLFFPNTGAANYGDRLDGLVEVSQATLDSVKTSLTEDEKVSAVDIDERGRILYFTITVQNDVSPENAKTFGTKVIENIDVETLKNYDIQILLVKTDAAENNFPISGYKSKNNENISWIRDREKTAVEEEKGEE